MAGRGIAQDDEQDRVREFPDCVSGLLASTKVCGTSTPPAERAAALVELLEPEEKLQNIIR
jgi:xylan 1,4-beta-xylosidase